MLLQLCQGHRERESTQLLHVFFSNSTNVKLHSPDDCGKDFRSVEEQDAETSSHGEASNHSQRERQPTDVCASGWNRQNEKHVSYKLNIPNLFGA